MSLMNSFVNVYRTPQEPGQSMGQRGKLSGWREGPEGGGDNKQTGRCPYWHLPGVTVGGTWEGLP